MLGEIMVLLPKSRLHEYIKNPLVRNIFNALCGLCICSDDKYEIEEAVAMTCSEAVRYAYKMSKELGIDKDTFLEGLGEIMSAEDEEYRLRHYN